MTTTKQAKDKEYTPVGVNPLNHNNEGLPLPRLQLRWEKDGENWSRRVCTYELVLPLRQLDIRAGRNGMIGQASVLRIQIGETKIESGNNMMPIGNDGIVDAPFRDGAHAGWDAQILNLPVWATCEEHSTKYPLPK